MYSKGCGYMIATKALDLRSNLKKYMDYAFRGEPVVIARPKNENVVIVSEKEYNELQKAKKNAEYLAKLDKSYEELKSGRTITLSMEELEAMEADDYKPIEKILAFKNNERK